MPRYALKIEYHGKPFAGWQKQRDAPSVQQAIEQVTKNRTVIVIAHRLSTIDYASRIIVLKNGSIKEEGTHDELMALEGDYFKLQTIQAAGCYNLKVTHKTTISPISTLGK